MATAKAKRNRRSSARTTPLGREIIAGLTELVEVAERGAPVAERFRVDRIELDLAPRPYGPDDVRRVRDAFGMSQAVFAAFLGVDRATVRSWEQGQREPSGIARRFLEELEAAPTHWRARVKAKVRVKNGKAPSSAGARRTKN